MSEEKVLLDLDHETTPDSKKRSVYEALRISRGRMDELVKVMKIAFIQNEKSNGDLDISLVLRDVVVQCNTPAEIVLVSFTVGEMRAERSSGFGGIGNILHMIIGKTAPKQEGGEEGEDPDIEEIIRKSYKINGKGKNKGED